MNETTIKYDNEPIFYCEACLSLKILTTDDEIDFCDLCGSININTALIKDWDNIYKERYGISYLKEHIK